MLRRIGLLPIFMILVLLTILALSAAMSGPSSGAKPGSVLSDRQVREMPQDRPASTLAGL